MKTLKTMKRLFLYLNFSIAALLHLSTTCTEKNWLQGKLDAFTHKMVTRHTYEHNSFEHMRDRALLFLLPPSIAQGVLTLQRSNMQKFLKQNEENTLTDVVKEFNLDDQMWSIRADQLDKAIAFNLKAMQEKGNYNTKHDPLLPQVWINALNHECARYAIFSENINFDTTIRPEAFAEAQNTQQYLSLTTYVPSRIGLNLTYAKNSSSERIKEVATHEMVHTIKGHSLILRIVNSEIYNTSETLNTLKNKQQKLEQEINRINFWIYLNPFNTINEEQLQSDLDCVNALIKKEYENIGKRIYKHSAYKNYRAAQEKTADTFVGCFDLEHAQNYVKLVKTGQLHGVYEANHNDVMVLDANWQTSQAIKDYQQLRSSIKQKLNAFPKFFV